MPLLVDTGFLYALADEEDAWHQRARRFLVSNRELLVVPASVLPETTYLLRERLGRREEEALISSAARGEISIEELRRDDYARSAELMARYPEFGFVDCSVVAIAERLGLTRLLTTDRRHFSFVRPRHVEALELLP